MKRILGLLVLLLSLQIFAGTSAEHEKEAKISISLGMGSPTNDDCYPRTLIPFTCVYTDGMVQLTLLGEVGDYILTVTNQQTGERWSAENALTLQTSMAIGFYVVEIELEDGTVYYGTYTL